MRNSLPSSGRQLVARLAAHVAFLLNAGKDGMVEVKPFALFQDLLALLAGRGDKGAVYRDGLVSYRLNAADRSAEEVAQAYIDRVLDRGFMLARAEHLHIAHHLFAQLCQRGAAPGWSSTAVRRGNVEAVAAVNTPADFTIVADRMKFLDKAISPGNPAQSTREMYGPLMLSAGHGNSIEVPEELSAWKAIIHSPAKQIVLETGAPFDRLCSTMIKAFEAANAHYGALVRLGLPPLDWMDAVSINTAKALSAFVTEVKVITGDKLNDLKAWQQAWEKRKVPGYPDADALWTSKVGRALHTPVIARREWDKEAGTLEDAEAVPDETADPEFIERERDFAELAEQAHADGVLSEFDVWLLTKVHAGGKLSVLAQDKRCIAVLAEQGVTLSEYLLDLEKRLRLWRREKPL